MYVPYGRRDTYRTYRLPKLGQAIATTTQDVWHDTDNAAYLFPQGSPRTNKHPTGGTAQLKLESYSKTEIVHLSQSAS